MEQIQNLITEYNSFKDRLLEIPFTTVEDYLNGLEQLAELTKEVESPRVIFYLPAAVSDFYLPADQLAEHKIQSRDIDGLNLQLLPVPKKLGLIKNKNANAFAISYKLETDPAILESKALSSLQNYQMDMVIANLLASFRSQCTIYSADSVQ